MKIEFQQKPLENAPAKYTRVRLTSEDKGSRRFVREGNSTYLEIGAGKHGDVTLRTFRILCRSIVTTAKQHKIDSVAIQLDRTPFKLLNDLDLQELASVVAENFSLANFEFTKHKSVDTGTRVKTVLVCGDTPKHMRTGFDHGLAIAKEVNEARTLANTPGGDMTPKGLAESAKKATKGLPITVRTLGVSEMKKLGMGALLGVGKGSSYPPTFTIMEYKGSKEAPIVLAGKGITFDSGGLNLKPSTSIYEMHMDMSGAAAVIHTITLVARLKLKKHVIALIPSAENMPGNEAYRPGDILKSMSGKTIEVLNTDAEGRLILADAITYAKRFNPAVVIDVATLTGAAMVALGLHANAVMSRDDELASKLLHSAEASGDYAWPLPLWDEYEASLMGTFADITNIGNGQGGRYGGAIEGGMFLWQFAKELNTPWAHIDIAPRMTSTQGDELAKGAVGSPIRMLVHFIREWNNS